MFIEIFLHTHTHTYIHIYIYVCILLWIILWHLGSICVIYYNSFFLLQFFVIWITHLGKESLCLINLAPRLFIYSVNICWMNTVWSFYKYLHVRILPKLNVTFIFSPGLFPKSRYFNLYFLIFLKIFTKLKSFWKDSTSVICALSVSHVRLFVAPWTVTCQAPLSMQFPGKNNEWVAISYSMGSLGPRNWTSLVSPALAVDSLPLAPPWKPICYKRRFLNCLPVLSGGFPGVSDPEESACNEEDLVFIPGSGRLK